MPRRKPLTKNSSQTRAGELLTLLKRGDRDAFDEKVRIYQGYP